MTGVVIERDGYWGMQWSSSWDPSLEDLLAIAPELVPGRRVAIASCDSGPYAPSRAEHDAGWRLCGAVAVSPAVTDCAILPAPGFDEWYVFDAMPTVLPACKHVNQFAFSILTAGADGFWQQVAATRPLHVLGAGTPNLFLVTRDRACVERLRGWIGPRPD